MLQLVGGGRGAPGFDPHFFSTLREVEDRHFWFVGRRQVVLSALRRAVPDLASRRLFDVGCGSGGLLAFLERSGVAVAGRLRRVPREPAARAARDRRAAGPRRRRPAAAARPGIRPASACSTCSSTSTTTSAPCARCASALAPGGALVLTVPAHPRLFDEMDEIAFHRRRYERAGLRRVLEESGFEVRLLSHFMSPLVPLLVLMRAAGRRLHGGRSRALERRRAEFRVVPG